MKVLFINGYTLKSKTPIENNVSNDILTPYISKAQDTHIQSFLGTDLYVKLMTDAEAGTLTGHYKTILDDYVIPCLIEWSFYEVLPFISLKLTNKSIGRGNADYLAEADLNDLKYLRGAVRDMADFYSQRLINYLREYSSEIAEYNQNETLDKMRPRYGQKLFGGIFTGGGSNDCLYKYDFPENRKYLK